MNPVSSSNNYQAAWRSGRHAFSLLELLVVIAILAILLIMSIPAIRSIGGGTEMTAAADLLVAQLNLARQMAITKNRNTELRLYSFNNEFGETRFHGLQVFISQEDPSANAEPVGRMLKLPSSACVDSGNTLSPLIAQSPILSGSSLGVSIPKVGLEYEAVSIGFRPDGSSYTTPAASSQNFLTLRPWRLMNAQTTLPSNYAIVQISKATGQIRSYRP
jgi:uncharacterized protein (TIGR02596 family)